MAAEADAEVAAFAGPLASRRVLLVEDELLIAMMLESALRQEGCIVSGPVARVAPAVAAAQSDAIDIAILDLDLAGENTRPVAEALERRKIPFLFLTGYGADGLPPDKPHWRALGKPFRMDALLALVAQLVVPAA